MRTLTKRSPSSHLHLTWISPKGLELALGANMGLIWGSFMPATPRYGSLCPPARRSPRPHQPTLLHFRPSLPSRSCGSISSCHIIILSSGSKIREATALKLLTSFLGRPQVPFAFTEVASVGLLSQDPEHWKGLAKQLHTSSLEPAPLKMSRVTDQRKRRMHHCKQMV